MRVAVTGHAGFIGTHLMGRLHNERIAEILPQQDCLDDNLEKADTYIHLAARSSVPGSITDPYNSYETNVMGTLNVLEACRLYGGKMIFTSSSQASADSPNPYGIQKHHAEELIRLYGKLYGVRYCILRLYNVFGPGDRSVIGAYQRAAEADKPLEVWGGDQRKDFVHIGAVVGKLIEAVNLEGTIEIGSGTTLSIQEVADMISDNQTHMPMPEGQPMETRCPTPVPSMSVKEYIELWKRSK